MHRARRCHGVIPRGGCISLAIPRVFSASSVPMRRFLLRAAPCHVSVWLRVGLVVVVIIVVVVVVAVVVLLKQSSRSPLQ